MRIESLTSWFLPFTCRRISPPGNLGYDLNLAEAERPGERHDLDLACSCGTERRGGRGGGGRRIIKKVNEADAALNGPRGGERAADVPSPRGDVEPPLARRRTCAAERVDDRQLPALAERARESLRRMVSALEPAVTVGRDEDERVDVRTRQLLRDRVRRERGQPPQPVLLPAGDDRADTRVVRDRRARGREREPAPRAFRATANRPRGRRAAALAERRLQPRQSAEARGADLRTGPPAGEAALRQQQLEHALDTTCLGVTQR